jgi:general secretion pathway protein D
MMRSRFLLLLLGTCLLTATTAFAQEPPAADDEKEVWEIAPDPEGVPIEKLFALIHENTGISIVYNPADPQVKNKRIFFTGRHRVPRDRIFDWLQAILSYQKLVLVPLGPKNYLQWAVLGVNDPAIANHPVWVPEEELHLWADRDGVYIVTTLRVNKLTDTTRARNALANLITRPVGRINDVPGTQAFVVGDFAPVVYSMARLVRAMDVDNPEFIPVFKMVRLKNAVATELEPIIVDLLAAGVGGPGRPARGRAPQGVGIPEKPDPVVRADPRQEAIVIYAVQEDVDRIEKIILELDSEVLLQRNNIQIYQCKHSLAGELAETLNELITATGLGSGTSASRPGRPARPGQPGPAAASQTETPVVIVADEVANALLIQANKVQFEDLYDLLVELDVRRPQVLIEAALIELRINDALNFGVELAATDNLALGKNGAFGVSNFGLSEFFDTNDDNIPDIRVPNIANGITAGIFHSDQFPVILQAFKGVNNARALSMPSVVVDDNREASITAAQSEPFLTLETTTAGSDRQGVEYVEAQTTLRISPHINSANYLKLHIEMEVSTFGTRSTLDLPPPTQSRLLSTDIVIPDRSTLIMGGIIDTRSVESVNKIPLLGDLPVLGYLFRNQTTETFKTNLFLFITPTILGDVGQRDEEYFRTYHEVSWSRKLLAEQLIDSELEIYNSRFRAAQLWELEPPKTPEESLERLEESGLLDFPSFHNQSSTLLTREQAREMFEQAREDAIIRKAPESGR